MAALSLRRDLRPEGLDVRHPPEPEAKDWQNKCKKPGTSMGTIRSHTLRKVELVKRSQNEYLYTLIAPL